MSSANASDSRPASLEDVWAVLGYHSKGKSCIETINRLWHKNQRMWGVANAPSFALPVLGVRRESWSAEELWRTLHADQVTNALPKQLDRDIVAIRWSGREYVIDGRRRISHWQRTEAQASLNVLMIIPAEV